MRAPVEIRIHDASIGIWQDDARDETFRADVYAPLIRKLRARGWSIKADPGIQRRYRSLSPDRRLGTRGTLCCKIEINGRAVQVEFWSTSAPQVNRNGRRYDFDKMARMAYLDRLRVELEFRRISLWLETLAPVKLSRSMDYSLSPIQRIELHYAESWHKVAALGRTHWGYDYNRKAKGGALLDQAQTVWLSDCKGRIIRGTAYYNLNSMWWVIAGGRLLNESCGCLYTKPPTDVRTRQNGRLRRKRLEDELSTAVSLMNFQRAELVKRILFGSSETFLIWARDHSAYYRAQYSGYTSDRISAGKYTRAEAEAECRRVPHELEMVCPDGSHVSFRVAA